MNIFDRLLTGEAVSFNDLHYGQIHEAASRTTILLANSCDNRS
jgi:hypothetical protein